MQTCSKCGAEIEEGGAFCMVCGTFSSTASTADPSSPTAAEAVAPSSATAAAPLPTEVKFPALTAGELASLTPFEILRKLESQLSCLIDEKDVPGWTVNPAYHPDVNAFIEANAGNSLFERKARALQQNRSAYFTKMRTRQAPSAPPRDPFADTRPDPVQTPLTKQGAESRERRVESGERETRDESQQPGEGPHDLAPRSPLLAPRPSRWRRRVALALAVLVLLPVGLILGASFYFRHVGELRLNDVLAVLDADDPEWRWDALEAKRAAIDDERNSALLVAELAAMLPEEWPEQASPLREALDLDPTDPLTNEQIEKLLLALDEHQAVLAKARLLAHLPSGCYPARSLEEVLSEPPPYLAGARALGNLLWLDAALLARGRKTDEALALSRCLLNVGRSVGDDPDLQAQLLRIESRRLAWSSIERALAHGEASADALQTAQQLLAEEQAQPVLLSAMLGHRARMHEVMSRLEANADGVIPARERDFVFDVAERDSPVGQAEHWLKVGWVQHNHALNLELMTRAVALARLPLDQQMEQTHDFDLIVKRMHDDWRSSLARRSLPDAVGTIQAYQRSQIELRCAGVALAVERHRLDHNAWPRDLQQLVPDYIPEVPRDPFDGKPLRLRSFPGGVMIYSVGPDARDNRGSFDRTDPWLADRDIGFRLWEVKQRPPPKLEWPPKNEKDELLRKMRER